jgi:aminoglycoside/choline kinase family phosphotransferase
VQAFLKKHGWGKAQINALAADFSPRIYMRLARAQPEPLRALYMQMADKKDLPPFIMMQHLLTRCAVRVPDIYAYDLKKNMALIEDLGDERLDHALNAGGDAAMLYRLAVDVLINLHNRVESIDAHNLGVPLFDAARLTEQAQLFIDMVEQKITHTPLPKMARSTFVGVLQPALEYACAGQVTVMMRDYHAANVMLVDDATGNKQAAVIDFQDGGAGPCAYDLVSLLDDTRRDLALDLHMALLDYYLSNVRPELASHVFQSYPILAVQRHLRVLGILMRRWIARSDKLTGSFYQRSWRLLMQYKTVPACAEIFAWLDTYIPEELLFVPPEEQTKMFVSKIITSTEDHELLWCYFLSQFRQYVLETLDLNYPSYNYLFEHRLEVNRWAHFSSVV